ncbi:MAG: hypothetical protein HUJ56_13260 [Erysipelotrichaceae bacterium]|nr:hypothetical protein [Erysipelotrichaceae bacterium]
MSLVNVNSALKREEIKALLAAQESPKYTFVKMKSAMEMQFEVTGDEDIPDIAGYTKKLIAKQPWGGVLYLRVLIEGQAFTGGSH